MKPKLIQPKMLININAVLLEDPDIELISVHLEQYLGTWTNILTPQVISAHLVISINISK